ncbi:putative ribosome biogenesis GTPase RsgA [Ktedonobacteria bacterium brp13]|nr:putative ribosome biogenesis GTPase RsgA [Ktedonobacteria bacterium brp13]
MINDPAQLTGMVLNGTHGIYDVHTEDGVLRCTLRGKLKKAFAQANSGRPTTGKPRFSQQRSPQFDSSNATRVERIERRDSSETPLPTRLSVGDYVKIRRIDDTTGLIEEILPRKSELSRMDAGSNERRQIQQTLLANLSQVVVVFATAQPEPRFALLDRYLTICEAVQLSPVICINKADLPHGPEIEEYCALYSGLGYRILFTSIETGEGIDELRTLLKDHITLFTGSSGVGKSSLVNALEPGMAVRTGLVSDATGKGRHTTTGSQLYPLSEGGWLADSAGIRALAAWNIAPEELAQCFIEFRPYLGECEYDDCAHIDEEGCAIVQAVEDGHINDERYRSYVRMYTGEER